MTDLLDEDMMNGDNELELGEEVIKLSQITFDRRLRFTLF